MWVPAPVCLCVFEVFIFIHNLAFLLIPYLHSLITACSSNRGSVCLSVSHIEALGPLNIRSTRHGCFATNECDKSPPRVASLYVPHTYRTASPQQMSPLFCRVCRKRGILHLLERQESTLDRQITRKIRVPDQPGGSGLCEEPGEQRGHVNLRHKYPAVGNNQTEF